MRLGDYFANVRFGAVPQGLTGSIGLYSSPRKPSSAQRSSAMTIKTNSDPNTLAGIDAKRWGLHPQAVTFLGQQLYDCWERFHACFKTRTRDTSDLAHVYLKIGRAHV